MTALTTTQITGRIALPDDVSPANAKVVFELASYDTDATSDVTVISLPIYGDIDVNGDIDVDVWSQDRGTRSRLYKVSVEVRQSDRTVTVPLGSIEVPSDAGPYDLNDLLPLEVPAGATVADFLAQLEASAARAETAETAAAASETAAIAARDATIAAAATTFNTDAAFIAADLTAYPDGTIVRVAGRDQIAVTGAISGTAGSIKNDWLPVNPVSLADVKASTIPTLANGTTTQSEGLTYIEVSADPDITTAGGRKLSAQPLPSEYVDRQFFPSADGATDDAAVYQRIASVMPGNKTLRIAGAGSRIIGSAVTFAQDGLKIVADQGAEFKQASSTLTLDTMIELSGDNCSIEGLKVNGNLAGNAGTYTGRGELLKMSGNHALLERIEIEGTQDVSFSTGIYLTGERATLRSIVSRNTGLNAVRAWTDCIEVDGLAMYDIYGASAHGFVQDSGFGGGVFKQAVLKNVSAFSTGTASYEAILFDDDGGQGGRVVVKDVYIDFPNATGPDSIKFAYVDDVFIDGLWVNHGDDSGDRSSLRFQQGIKRVGLRNTDLAGGVNFDGAVEVDLRVGGDCRIGRVYTIPNCIQQVPGGRVVVEDGAQLLNYTASAISMDATDLGRATRFELGSMVLEGTDGDEPILSFPTSTVLTAGQVRVKDPLKITNARTRAANGSWITDSLAKDAACIQGAAGEFLVNLGGGAFDYLTEDGPDNIDGWDLGMMLRHRNPTAGGSVAMRVCTTAGSSETTAYANSTALSVGARVYAGGNVYKVTVAGTTDASGTGPTHTTGTATDGTVTFEHVAAKAVFKSIASIGA